MDHIVRILIENCIIQNSAGFLVTHFYYLIILMNQRKILCLFNSSQLKSRRFFIKLDSPVRRENK